MYNVIISSLFSFPMKNWNGRWGSGIVYHITCMSTYRLLSGFNYYVTLHAWLTQRVCDFMQYKSRKSRDSTISETSISIERNTQLLEPPSRPPGLDGYCWGLFCDAEDFEWRIGLYDQFSFGSQLKQYELLTNRFSSRLWNHRWN
jgi:hypothetical protein